MNEQPNTESKPESLSPVGLTMPCAKSRLDKISEAHRVTDPEHIMMRLWESENVRRDHINYGLTPLEVILHKCTDKCRQPNEIYSLFGATEHIYQEPSERDIRIVAAAIQWLATSCGRGFLDEFRRELEKLNK